MIKVVLFDIDGLLIHQERFSEALARDYGLSIEKTQAFFLGPFQECLTGKWELKGLLPDYLPSWGWEKGVDAFLEVWFAREYKLNQELLEYIKDLRTKGVKCFLATNQEKHRFQYIIEKMGFAHNFDRAYASAHLGHKKPDQEFFAKIFSELRNISKEEILFWDDREVNIKGAKDFGINAELYTDFPDFQEKMKQYL